MKKFKLNLLTFLSITITIMLFGFVGVYYSVQTIRAQYIDIQIRSNQRAAETIARLFSDKINSGVQQEDLIQSFQSAIEGSYDDEGYLCMYDQLDGKLLCHPDTNAIGMSIISDQFRFQSTEGFKAETLWDVVSTDKSEFGILSSTKHKRSEITSMVPVSGTSWKISVHENLSKTDQLLWQLELVAFTGFLILSLIISLISTWIVRILSRKHEKIIEHKKLELEASNIQLIKLNDQVENQKNTITKHAENLESEVERRTVELRTLHAKLAGLEKAKSDFLNIISHELRTPLNGIIGFSTLLEDELINPEHLDFVQNIKISGERLFKFSETALLVTQLNAQSDRLEYQKITISEIINENWDSISQISKAKNVILKVDQEAQKYHVNGVPRMIKQCFLNILENAVDHSPEAGEVRITVIAEPDTLNVHVIDDGPGFSEEAFLRQFDLFGADKVMNHTKGFGLGLAAAQLIMRAHSGEIHISNHTEGGAIVCLKFPRIVGKIKN
ncbi:MAG: hypothetical protein CVT92_12625 [Bacteroidetes bacterium HGW-Bacteroidetes-1]|jgi:two-component system sensor histidine kinase/response regulator|nr:MAG: hypothetical protein CVT92_12625 [Bacteroidetes bacterium HGW-Bacteroidetes-1]